jgi:hypothetical protein
MSEEVTRRMTLSRLKKFVDSISNLTWIAEDTPPDFSLVETTHSKMLLSSNIPTTEISINANQSEIDQWVLSSFESFGLADSFYLSINDFSYMPWIRVQVQGAPQSWLLPLYHELTNRCVQFVTLDRQSIFELREREHHLVSFVEHLP